jgi:hypothetical protein
MCGDENPRLHCFSVFSCMGRRGLRRDIAGQKYELLTAMRPIGELKPRTGTWWECLCECGKTRRIPIGRWGRTASCGCAHNKSKVTHGRSKTREYQAYHHAIQRCNDPKTRNYEYWGGRGIKFLFTSFEQFFAEVGKRPVGHSLDRINNNGHYEPDNVRWATTKEQGENRCRKCGGDGYELVATFAHGFINGSTQAV